MRHSLRGFSRKRILVFLVSVSVLIISPFALADIISGNSLSGVSNHATYTQLPLSIPSGSQGDLMLASIAVDDGSSDVVTPPAGWTQIARTDNDVNVTLISYWKIAGSQEPDSYIWLINNQTRAVGGITRYSGVDSTHPIDTIASNTGFSSTATTTAITTSAANEEVVSLFATNVAKTFGTPTGMNQKYNLSHAATVGPSTAAFDTLQVATSSTGSTASTIDPHASRYWSTQQIALRYPSPSYIAVDTHNGTSWSESVGPYTLPLTISGNNRLLLVGVTIDDPTNPDQVTGATFGGNNLTLIAKEAVNSNGNDETYLFAMVAPPTGTNNLMVTTSGTPENIWLQGVDYTNVDQVIPTNYIANMGVDQSSFSVGRLVSPPNSWAAGLIHGTAIVQSSTAFSLSSPNVIRDDETQFHSVVMVDSNGPTGGSDTVIANGGYGYFDGWTGIVAELAPVQ